MILIEEDLIAIVGRSIVSFYQLFNIIRLLLLLLL